MRHGAQARRRVLARRRRRDPVGETASAAAREADYAERVDDFAVADRAARQRLASDPVRTETAALAFCAIARSKRLSDLLEALSGERLGAARRPRALAAVWRR